MLGKSEGPNFVFGNHSACLGQSGCFNFLGWFALLCFEKSSDGCCWNFCACGGVIVEAFFIRFGLDN